MAEKEVLQQSSTGAVVIYRESPEERAERLERGATQALRLTRGQLRVLRRARAS